MVYLTGESYAGTYLPYIGAEMLSANDGDNPVLGGVMLNDPVIGDPTLQIEGEHGSGYVSLMKLYREEVVVLMP